MNFKRDKKIFQLAIDSGCKTAASFALFIKLRKGV